MARTKASVGSKVSSGKSSKARCSAAPPPSSTVASGSSEKTNRGHSGGNSVCPRETPKWQRPITNFFINKDPGNKESHSDTDDACTAGSSKSKPKRNIIESDDEDVTLTEAERPKNKVLDETIELEPLTGDDSHKIDEYYLTNGETGKVNGETKELSGETDKLSGETGKLSGETGKLSGVTEDSRKIKGKGKGKGKKTINKENLNNNIEKRQSMKRDLEEITFGEESEHVSKKVKV